ncbi:hypothetical protein PVAND_008629 [Polypedilum vanderplanki]|uniref:Uncharacterized protein n=1 Tax=Polypedilum vanderplanki TaxID=319348 RepID=A0A9J6CBB1_POLVA|nr:hypothetical protein PVAND_008629 [Polypedilum vanderplanki]
MEEKIICVTGASSGIGSEICVELAKNGSNVVIGLARRVDKINELNERLPEELKGKIIGRKCDVENEEEINNAFVFIKNEYGKLDIFVNNAGILMTDFVTEEETKNIRKLFDINVIGSCICLKEAINLMKETSGKGHVIVMNSILGHRIPDMPPNLKPPFGLYPSSKHALTALCQTLRQEMSFLKLPIRITSISPGMVDSDLLSGFNQQLVSMLPKLKVEDIAEAVKYVLNTPERVRVDDIIINPMF